MILIADSGSTKTDWALVDTHHRTVNLIHTQGYNPYVWTGSEIQLSLASELIPYLGSITGITHIHYYGAGCGNTEKQDIVRQAIAAHFSEITHIEVSHDLLASARALLGNTSGFAAILGTGTNSCIYDGTKCIQQVQSLGYLMGDEGSGSYIGKQLLRDFFRDDMPIELSQAFAAKFHILSKDTLLSDIYAAKPVNKRLASYATFCADFADTAYINLLLKASFTDFFKNTVTRYPDYNRYTLNVVGSIAVRFASILDEVAQAYRMQVGKLIQSPINELVTFHSGMAIDLFAIKDVHTHKPSLD